MPLIKCPECGHDVSDMAGACPNCGRPMKPKPAPRPRKKAGCLTYVVSIIVALIVFGAIKNTFTDETGKHSQATAAKKAEKPPCGLAVNSAWDGSVSTVESYLKNILKDPSSFDAIEWSEVKKIDDKTCAVRCKYRAKNSFGGYAIENTLFYLDLNGHVTRTENFPE